MASSFLSPATGADAAADTGAEEVVQHTDVSEGGDSGNAGADAAGDSANVGDESRPQETQDAGKADAGAWKQHVGELSKTNKKLADQIKGDRYKVTQFEQAGFKTPEEAVALRDMLETYGGQEGLEALQADAQEFGQEISQMAAGDPKLLDKLAAESPEGLAKLVPHGVSLFKKLDPEGYQSLQRSLAHENFEANNVYSHVQLLLDTITAGGEGAQKRAADLVQTLQGYLDTFKKGAASGGANKEREAWLKEKQDYETKQAAEKEETFAKTVLDTVNPEVTRQVREHLQSFVPKGYKLPEATENALIESVFKGINAKLLEKQDYQNRYQSLLKTGDPNRVSKFIRSRVDPILRDLTKSAYDVFRGANPTMRRTAPPANGTKPSVQADKGAKSYKPTLQEALRSGVTKEEWLMGTQSKKIVKNGKTLYQWN